MNQVIAVLLPIAVLIICLLTLSVRAYRLAATEGESRATLRGLAIATASIVLALLVGKATTLMVAPYENHNE